MSRWIVKLLGILACSLLAQSAYAEGNADVHSQVIPWALAAHSDLIAVGTLVNYAVDDSHASGYTEIDVSSVLKGSIPTGLLHTELGVSGELSPFLKANRGRKVIAFLMGGSNGHRTVYQLYEPDGPAALITDTDASEALIRAELDREQYQTTTIPAFLNKQTGETRDRVDDAIDKVSSYFKWRRDQGIDELLRLGCKGVPYIVMHLNDGRPVYGMMRLFEGENDWIWTPADFDKHGPRTVGEALPKVLWQITGLTWKLIDPQELNNEMNEKQYQFWLVYLANHVYQRDPDNYGQWSDQCVGALW